MEITQESFQLINLSFFHGGMIINVSQEQTRTISFNLINKEGRF